MQTNRVESVSVITKRKASVVLALGILASFALAGCSENPVPGSEAYKEGELGNGDFLFACDDGVACLPYSGDAKKFPKAIATGATFDVRFVANDEQGTDITSNGSKYQGLKTTGLAPFVSDAPGGGFAAVKPGFGTVIVRDSGGSIVDYVTLNIVQPDTLVVYDANYEVSRGKDPPQIQSATVKVEGRASYRVVAGYSRESVAGSIPVDWTSDDTSVVAIETYTKGVVNVVAKKAGKTTLTAKGANVEKKIEVEVTP